MRVGERETIRERPHTPAVTPSSRRRYDDQNCFNVQGFEPGHGDAFRNNTCLLIGETTPKEDTVGNAASCDPNAMLLSDNAYYTQHANASVTCGGVVLPIAEVQAQHSNELRSTAGPLPDDATVIAWMRAKLAL